MQSKGWPYPSIPVLSGFLRRKGFSRSNIHDGSVLMNL
jgi:hypothetical protein